MGHRNGNPTGRVRQPPVPIPPGDTPRLRLARQVRALRDQGYILAEVAVILGISRSYAAEVDRDPDGSRVRARKDRYRRACIDCGRPTDGSNGAVAAPDRCCHCAPRANAIWTRERIIEAIREFHAEHGRIPTAGELGVGPNRADHVRGLPFHTTLRYVFGTAAEAMRAAGFEPRGAGNRLSASDSVGAR